MKMSFSLIILILAATVTALIAGLFYAWTCSVMPGLGRLSDGEFVAAMQAMNRAILNPVFFLSFMGTLVLLPLAAFLHYGNGSVRFWLLLSASIVYVVGVFGVTMVGNVPLNNALDALNLKTASAGEITALRTRFEGPWNALNIIRTLASILAIILVIVACLSHREADQ